MMIVQLLMCVTAQDKTIVLVLPSEVDGKPASADGLYPLLKRPGNTYGVDFRNTYKGRVDYWKEFRKDDLVFLYYQTADSITVSFETEESCSLGSGSASTQAYISTGLLVLQSLKGVYDIYADGGVRMQVWCDGGSLSLRGASSSSALMVHLRALCLWTRLNKLLFDRYLDRCQKSCPALNLKKGRDLASMTFATGVTVVIPVEGALQLLERL
ncbi:hypothetical protein FOZ60_005365 [Perkinsus olseni]|uniref:Uncharacterized protein n=1 Tax=Perkinsus olseni TaxID=32597 RepID=A0A7J6NRB6_PEROL|nr:hypothetical protein FOZ60_005365 [Perkinsus olseni]